MKLVRALIAAAAVLAAAAGVQLAVSTPAGAAATTNCTACWYQPEP